MLQFPAVFALHLALEQGRGSDLTLPSLPISNIRRIPRSEAGNVRVERFPRSPRARRAIARLTS